MRTTVDIPEDLMEIALALSPARTKRQVLTTALEEYVRKLLREQLRAKRGTAFLDMTQEDLERMRQDG